MREQRTCHPLKNIKVAYVSTVPWFLVTQLKSQIEYMRVAGMDVTLISSPGWEDVNHGFHSDICFIPIEMKRALSPLRDLSALFKLYRMFRKNGYDIVHSMTPKAGLLTALAAFSARIPVRIHTFTGQPWVTMKGWLRRCARYADWIIGKTTSQCYADSRSQWKFLIGERIIAANAISVLGHGSLAGVDLKRFDPSSFTLAESAEVRRELSIETSAKVIVFIGRLARDKGITELVSAFDRILSRGYHASLLLVGPVDERDAISDDCMNRIHSNPRIVCVKSTRQPERYLAASDIFCLPSYREGFGTTIIEAASMGIPAVATTINGIVDAVDDGRTGVLVPPRDALSLEKALTKLLDSPDLMGALGRAARKRCVEQFDSNIVNGNVSKEYMRMLG